MSPPLPLLPAPSAPDLTGLSDLAGQTRGWDALETVSRIAAREVSGAEVVAAAQERARAWEPTLGAVVVDDAEGVARSLPPAEGLLHSVPTYIKDLDDVAGLPTGMGSSAVPDRVARATAACVSQFLSTGPVVLGKSATAEFGLTCTTEPVGGRPSRNPWNLGHSSGGSSGGAASLVSAGVVPLAYGSDGGGSIRIPAACCGLVGLKASRGRLRPMDRSRMMPVQVATYGVLTRSVRDTWAFYEAVERAGVARGLAPVGRMANRTDEPLRVGVFTESLGDGEVDPEVQEAVLATGRLLEDLGHTVVEVPSPFSRGILEDFLRYWGLLATAVRRMVDRELGGESSRLEPWTLALAAEFTASWTTGLAGVWRLRRFGPAYAAAFDDLDVLLGPTIGATAPPLGHVSPDLDYATKRPRIEQLVPFTPFQNVSGAPALSLPAGVSSAGLPLAVHLSARVGEERRLLTLAAALEEARPWRSLPASPMLGS